MTVGEDARSARAWRAPESSEQSPVPTALISQTCERLITELFADAPAPSIHAQLSERCARCDESRADFAALAPSPALNRCLSRLVEIARGQFGFDVDEPTRSAIAQRLWRRIVEWPQLRRKAHAIRRIAACAEAQMEHHFSSALVSSLAERPLLGCQAVWGAEARLREVLAGFPYVDSYAHLVRAERALLNGSLPAGLAARDAELRSAAAPMKADSTLAFCGCGPLPLTGFMLHLETGARVVLIDRDPSALAQAARLTHELERVGVLARDAFELRLADAGDLSYGRHGAANERRHVRCDAVLVASLVPHEAKLRIAERVRESRAAEPLALILRSAAGLCAELAYEPVRTEQIEHARLRYCGESVPRHQLPDAHATRDGALALARAPFGARTARTLLGIADASVLNTSELYLRVPCDVARGPHGRNSCPSHAAGFDPEMRLLCA